MAVPAPSHAQTQRPASQGRQREDPAPVQIGLGAGSPTRPVLVQGVGSAYEPPKISELPNVAGQACCGEGTVGTAVPFAIAACAAARQVSIAGQSAALRVSFHTTAPYVLVATAYT